MGPIKDLYTRFNERMVYLDSGCIITTWNKTQRGGHTLVKYKYKQRMAHRLAWELYVGEIPKGLQINHKCNNAKCVNIEHLYVGTQKDNIKDCIDSGNFPWKNLRWATRLD